MKRIFLPLLVVLLTAPAAAALERTQTAALVRIAEKASGLRARAPVRVVAERPEQFRQRQIRLLDRSYPRAARSYDATVYRALGLLRGGQGVLRKTVLELETSGGLYDAATRTVHVRGGRGERGAALHQIVHALQDQRYDLRGPARAPDDGDAARAAAAAAEGHATLAVGEVGPRRRTSAGDSKLTRFLELERGFAAAVGLRFAADLRNLGGNRALLGALARLPATTEQVFHLDKYLERERALPIVLPAEAGGMTLLRAGSFGELDIRALLAVFGVPRLDRAGSGWGGGRTGVYRSGDDEAVLVALDWDTELDALQWAAAVALYVDAAFDAASPGPPAPVPCAAAVCWQLGDRAIAFAREGTRTSLAFAGAIEPAAALTVARVALAA